MPAKLVEWENMLLELVPAQDQGAAIQLIGKIKSVSGVDLNKRELATILFALRMYQNEYERAEGEVIDPCGFFSEGDPLSLDEVDSLCYALNIGGDNA